MMQLPGVAAYASMFLTLALISGIACLGLNLQWGQTGLFNAGIAGFIAIGAYVSALLTTAPVAGRLAGPGWPMAVGWLAAAAAAGTASALVGAATLRLRSDSLAIATFGSAVVVQLVIRNAQGLTGGVFGVGFIPRPFDGLADRPLLFGCANLALVATVSILLFLALERMARSPWGRVLRAIREDERAARALGKSPERHRLQAFALGGALMGLAGALQAHMVGFIAPDNYEAAFTFQIWTMLIVGGSGNNGGAWVGAVLVSMLWSATGLATSAWVGPADQARAATLRIIVVGVLLAAVLVLRPRGLIGERLGVSRHLARAAQSRSRSSNNGPKNLR